MIVFSGSVRAVLAGQTRFWQATILKRALACLARCDEGELRVLCLEAKVTTCIVNTWVVGGAELEALLARFDVLCAGPSDDLPPSHGLPSLAPVRCA